MFYSDSVFIAGHWRLLSEGERHCQQLRLQPTTVFQCQW